MITREQLLEAAIQVFGQMGYSQSTIQDVATAAKVGKGSVYIFFESKAEILFEACKAHVAQCFKEVLPLLEKPQINASEAMDKLIQYFYLEIIPYQSKSCFLFYELLVLAATDLNYREKIAELLSSRQSQTEQIFLKIYEAGLLSGEFQELKYPLEFFRSFLASVDGLIYQHSFRPQVLRLDIHVKNEKMKFQKFLYKETVNA